MVIEQSNMEAKRFTGYSQGRRQVFTTGVQNCSFFLLPPFPFLLLFLVILVEAGGSGPPDPWPALSMVTAMRCRFVRAI